MFCRCVELLAVEVERRGVLWTMSPAVSVLSSFPFAQGFSIVRRFCHNMPVAARLIVCVDSAEKV
jgi:hypothetical protein